MAATNTSPTLTLKITAPQALANLQELRTSVDALKASLAGLGASSGGSGVTRLEAQVRELRAALRATQLEVESLHKANELTTAAAIAGKQREVAAVKMRTQAVKSAVEEEKAAEEAKAAYLLKVQLRSAEMTGALAIKANAAVEASLAQHIAKQEAMQERAAARQAALVERQAATAIASQAAATRAVDASLQAQVTAQERAAASAVRAQNAAAAAAARRAEVEAAANAGATRSVTRGLAAAGGSTFLTYGANIPAVVGGYAAGATVAASIRDGSEFNYQTQFSGALGGMNPREIANMREELRKLGTDSIYGPIELAKGMRVLEQAGIGANDALKILPTSMKVALQGETDLTKASETLVGVMNQFGLSVKDVPRIGDAMSKTASVTQANMGSLMESMKTFIGISQRYNVSLEQSLTLMGLLAKQGITGQSAGTFTRRFFEELYAPRSMDARRAFRELGYSSGGPGYDDKGNMRSADEVVNDFSSRMRGFDTESQNKLLSAIFDQRSIKTASVLINDLANEFTKLRKQIDESGGALAAFDKMMSGETKMLWKQVTSNFEGAMIDMFKTIEEPLNGLLTQLRDFFKDEAVTGFLKLVAMIPAGYMSIAGFLGNARAKETAAERLAVVDQDIAKYRSLGGTEDGLNLRSDQLRGQLALRAKMSSGMLADQYAPTMAAENAAMLNRGVIFGREPSADGASPARRASMRVIDPLTAAEQHQLSIEREREAVAAMRRETQRLDQTANDQQRILDVQHKYGLISEEQYSQKIEQINEDRRLSAVAMANQEIADLQSRVRAKWTPAEVARNEERQREIAAQRDRLVRESEFNVALRNIQDEGKLRGIERGTEAIAEKHGRAEDLRLEQLKLKSDTRLMPAEVAAEYLARFDARKSYEEDLKNVDSDINKYAGDGKQVDALRERKRVLLEMRDAYVQMRGEEAKLRTERERTWGYGQEEVFAQYTNAATDAAQNARDAWTVAFKSIEDALFSLVKTGKASWRDYATAVGDEILRQQIRKATATATNTFVAPALNYLGNLFTSTAHTGGIIGTDSLTARSVPASTFAGAPRFHGGGIVGGEMPIIAQYGEGVFTPAQMQALGGGVGGGGHTFIIDARGADSAGMARLEARIAAIHGSIEYRSVAAVRKAYATKGVRTPA